MNQAYIAVGIAGICAVVSLVAAGFAYWSDRRRT